MKNSSINTTGKALRSARCALRWAVRRAPNAEGLLPTTHHRRSEIGNPQPATSRQKPEAKNQKPAASRRHPAASIEIRATRTPHPVTRDPHHVSGFTLMEILLAFLILAIVVSTILGSFDAVFSTTDALENSSKYFDMAKNCLQRMSLDLEALYVSQPPFYKKPEMDDPPDPYRLVGTNGDISGTSFANLRFTSNAHVPMDNSGRSGIAEIVYYVHTKTDGQLVLRRADHLFPYPPFEEKGGDAVLCQDVKSLAFKYYDAEGEESDAWNSDTADYDHATPRAIGIELEVGNETDSYTFETTVRLAVHRKKME